MKQIKRLILPIVTLVFTILAISTTTFAWFTLSKVATISNIEAEVTSGEGLEIALGFNNERLTDYKTNLTEKDWKIIYEKFDQFKFNAVTTNDLKNYYKLEYENGINGPGLYQKEANENKDYLVFDIFFKSNTDGIVNLNDYKLDGDIVTFVPTVEYIQFENNENKTKQEVKTKASSALRVAINDLVLQDNKNEYNQHTTNKVVEYGQYSYLNSMGNNIYWNKELIEKENFETIQFIDAETELSDKNIKLELKKENDNYYSQAKIKLWIEGWDADAYDSIFGAKLNVNLTFIKENKK